MRQYIRHPSDIPIHFQVDEQETPTPQRVKDVSLGGLCFTTDKALKPGSAIHIRIPLSYQVTDESTEASRSSDSSGQGFDADGVVAWCRSEGDGYAVGVQFADPSTQFGVRMVEQVCHIEHYRYDLALQGRDLSREEAAREWVERFAEEFP